MVQWYLANLTFNVRVSHAYMYTQLNVDEESQEYLTINTHKGLYSYKKLPYGVKCVCNQDDNYIGEQQWLARES